MISQENKVWPLILEFALIYRPVISVVILDEYPQLNLSDLLDRSHVAATLRKLICIAVVC